MEFRKNAVLAEIESTYATDPTPTGSADAVLCVVRSFAPMENQMAEREVALGDWFGHQDAVPVATLMRLAIDVEMVGSGVVDTAPQWGKLVRAAGFAETVNTGTSVVYSPVSASIPSLTFYVHWAGVRHKMLGARASKLGMKVSPRGIPYFQFEFMGLYGGVADVAFPSQTLTAWKTPIAVNNANTGSFALHSYSGKLYDMQIDLNPRTVHQNVVGGEAILITDRKPSGRLTIEEPLIATKDFWTIARTPTLSTLSITHGVTTGFKVKIDSALVQILNPTREDRDGVSALQMGLHIRPGSSGNDDFTITNL